MRLAASIRPDRPSRPVASLLFALACAGVALSSYRYVAGVGPIPPVIAENALRHPWLVIHVIGAATALLIGPAQFSSRLRQRAPSAHRWTGRIYVAGCLIGSVAGLCLAFGVTSGPIAMAGFGLLAVAWFVTTWLGWRAAVKRNFAEHQAWMIRSFALTFAAVTLRIMLGILALLPVPFSAGYIFISFACWVPNLVLAEAYLRTKLRRAQFRSEST